jgi:hypothetical protein
MNQLEALRETIRLAEEAAGMPERPGNDVGLAHLRHMAATAEAGNFGAAKLGRWFGWAQCALVAANVGVTLADMKSLNAKWLTEDVAPTEFGHLDTDSSSPISAAPRLEHYPWVVWTVALLDPERLAGANVAERTAAAAKAAAELYGCVYEYCVDEDTMADGTKYYEWYIGGYSSRAPTAGRQYPRGGGRTARWSYPQLAQCGRRRSKLDCRTGPLCHSTAKRGRPGLSRSRLGPVDLP